MIVHKPIRPCCGSVKPRKKISIVGCHLRSCNQVIMATGQRFRFRERNKKATVRAVHRGSKYNVCKFYLRPGGAIQQTKTELSHIVAIARFCSVVGCIWMPPCLVTGPVYRESKTGSRKFGAEYRDNLCWSVNQSLVDQAPKIRM